MMEGYSDQSGLISAGYVRNAPVVDYLFAALNRGDHIVELIGGYGSGKTTLLQSLKYDHPPMFNGKVEYFLGSDAFRLNDALDVIADSLRQSQGKCILAIDDADRMDRGDLFEGINRLSTGPWSFSTVLASRKALDIGRRIDITPLSKDAVRQMLGLALREHVPTELLEKLWATTQGLPDLASILADSWRGGKVRSLDALANLFSPLVAPGLVDPHGRPISSGSHEEKAILSDVRFVSEELLKAVSQDPNLVHALTPREFEELSAELFQRQGYQVTITPKTRDGGKDLYLAKADGFGSFLYIVECKCYAPDNPVDVGVVRALYGVAQHERVNAAMTLTTSYFSKDAENFATDIKYQLKLKDFVDLKLLLDPYRNQ